jgi:hypothetical protein
LKEIWGIRIRLQMAKSIREMALFNLFRKHFRLYVAAAKFVLEKMPPTRKFKKPMSKLSTKF